MNSVCQQKTQETLNLRSCFARDLDFYLGMWGEVKRKIIYEERALNLDVLLPVSGSRAWQAKRRCRVYFAELCWNQNKFPKLNSFAKRHDTTHTLIVNEPSLVASLTSTTRALSVPTWAQTRKSSPLDWNGWLSQSVSQIDLSIDKSRSIDQSEKIDYSLASYPSQRAIIFINQIEICWFSKVQPPFAAGPVGFVLLLKSFN